MSSFNFNQYAYDQDDERRMIQEIYEEEQRRRQEAELYDTFTRQAEAYRDTQIYMGSVATDFYAVEELQPKPFQQLSDQLVRNENIKNAAELDPTLTPNEYQARINEGQAPSLYRDQGGQLVRGFQEINTGLGSIDANRDAMWIMQWGSGETNRSVSGTNSQASYLRSRRYSLSPFSSRSLESMSAEERQLLPDFTDNQKSWIENWEEYSNNWSRLGRGFLAAPFRLELPDYEALPFLSHATITPDSYWADTVDPNFNGEQALELFKKYEPERYAYLETTGFDMFQAMNADSVGHFNYQINEHFTQVAFGNAMAYHSDIYGDGIFSDSWTSFWALGARPFLFGTLHDADMPLELAAAVVTTGGSLTYTFAKNANRVRKIVKMTDAAERAIELKKLSDSLMAAKRFQERASSLIPSNWAVLNQYGSIANYIKEGKKVEGRLKALRGQSSRMIQANFVQGLIEGGAYYGINYVTAGGTEAEFEFSFKNLGIEMFSEGLGQVVLAPVIQNTSALGLELTGALGTGLFDGAGKVFGDSQGRLLPQEVTQTFEAVARIYGVKPEDYDNMSYDQKIQFLTQVQTAIELKAHWKAITGTADPNDASFPPEVAQLLNQVFADSSPEVQAAFIGALGDVAEMVEGSPRLSVARQQSKQEIPSEFAGDGKPGLSESSPTALARFSRLIGEELGGNLTGTQATVLIVEAMQKRLRAQGDPAALSSFNADQIIANITLSSAVRSKADEMGVSLDSQENVETVLKAIQEEVASNPEAFEARVQSANEEIAQLVILKAEAGMLAADDVGAKDPSVEKAMTPGELVDLVMLTGLRDGETVVEGEIDGLDLTEARQAVSDFREEVGRPTEEAEFERNRTGEDPSNVAQNTETVAESMERDRLEGELESGSSPESRRSTGGAMGSERAPGRGLPGGMRADNRGVDGTADTSESTTDESTDAGAEATTEAETPAEAAPEAAPDTPPIDLPPVIASNNIGTILTQMMAEGKLSGEQVVALSNLIPDNFDALDATSKRAIISKLMRENPEFAEVLRRTSC